ncbi:acetyltransferase [Limnohabitans sp. T6-5]|uniref:DUF1840 domain-containing protein n=1 Tax=Limnohabitans sp. T6-5 TaxID=1100724 RepID=UPI000D3B9167|nr:DUF1840 domain-containing protein [Limnohabitans sp. T6-5]PUE08546.1 acetyltransferase [Limnohabitans sp. T6-5]
MLFKFKSHAASDLIMLEADACRLLKIMLGDDPVKGIVQAQALPGVIAALELAVAQDEALRMEQAEKALKAEGNSSEESASVIDSVRLAQRATPMLKFLKLSLAEESNVVWGV